VLVHENSTEQRWESMGDELLVLGEDRSGDL
jgi:hypothetical protein